MNNEGKEPNFDINLQHLQRKTAKSGKVDYAPTVILSETARTRLKATAFFVPRSNHDDFKLKIEPFKINRNGAWELVKEKVLNIGDESSRQLLKFLQSRMPLTDEQQAGDFIAIRISDGDASNGGQDREQSALAIKKLLSQEDFVKHLSEIELTQELASALRGSIRLAEMRAAVAELRTKLDSDVCDEQHYQEWCEKHCWAFGNAHVVRDELRTISAGDKLDILLPTVIAGYRDIVELKRPDKEVLIKDTSHRNFYFSNFVSQAIGQCHRYLDVLHETAQNGLRDHEEIVAYHPRATIVIGRSSHWGEPEQKALHGLNRRLHGISVMTYDHLLAQGERLLDMIGARDEESAETAHTSDDDMPW